MCNIMCLDHNTSLEEVDGAMLDALRSNIVSRLDETRERKKVEKKVSLQSTYIHVCHGYMYMRPQLHKSSLNYSIQIHSIKV